MKKWLQAFDFQRTDYDRITQKWQCGNQHLGQTCVDGPTRKGKCQAGPMCRPVKLPGMNKWVCTRTKKAGGKCQDGPLANGACCLVVKKCKPQLNSRFKKRRIAALVCFIGITIISVMGGTDYYRTLIDPGPLSASHSHITDCGACHHAFHQKGLSWIPLAFLGRKNSDQEVCLTCHNMGENPLLPHNLSSKILAAKTQEVLKKSIKSTSLTINQSIRQTFFSDQNKMSCVLCHKEHNSQRELTQVSDVACQSCHVNQFDGLKNGHPDFKQFPSQINKTRMVFDHVKHFNEYYSDKKYLQYTKKDCLDCHYLTSSGQMRHLSFENTCQGCHQDQITGKNRLTEKGIPFFALPQLDLETLKAKHIPIGEWPEQAESELTPFSLFILGLFPELKDKISHLKEMDLEDLSEATHDELMVVNSVAWGLKSFLYDFSRMGPKFIIDIFAKNEIKLDDKNLNYVELMSEDTLVSAKNHWFPNLDQEMQRQSEQGLLLSNKINNHSLSQALVTSDSVTGESWAQLGGWYRENYILYYKPKYHKDPFMVSWLKLLGQAEIQAKFPSTQEIFKLLAAKQSPGSCTKCHTVEKKNSTKLIWAPLVHDRSMPHQALFNHSSHLNLFEEGCKGCHQFNDSDYLGSFESNDRRKFASSFKYLEKTQCAQCHDGKKVFDSCTGCHQYHVSYNLLKSLNSAAIESGIE